MEPGLFPLLLLRFFNDVLGLFLGTTIVDAAHGDISLLGGRPPSWRGAGASWTTRGLRLTSTAEMHGPCGLWTIPVGALFSLASKLAKHVKRSHRVEIRINITVSCQLVTEPFGLRGSVEVTIVSATLLQRLDEVAAYLGS